jgi:hypothetical protein
LSGIPIEWQQLIYAPSIGMLRLLKGLSKADRAVDNTVDESNDPDVNQLVGQSFRLICHNCGYRYEINQAGVGCCSVRKLHVHSVDD